VSHVLAFLCATALASLPESPLPILTVGPPADLKAVAADLGIRLRPVDSVAEAVRSGRPVIVTAPDYPQPRLLSPAEIATLWAFLEAGGRALVEFARPTEGDLFGLQVSSEPEWTMFERLLVRTALNLPPVAQPAGGSLEPETLLEEHHAAALHPTAWPEGSRTILEYGRFFGTYRRVPPPCPTWSVTVDLGREVDIAAVVGHFGAGQPNYCPERVTVSLSSDGQQWPEVAREGERGVLLASRVDLAVDNRTARFVRLTCEKVRRSPVTDWFFIDEVEVLDAAGRNVARGQPYTISGEGMGPGSYADDGHKLADGQSGGSHLEGQAVGFTTPPPCEENRRPALVEVPVGRGQLLWCSTRISDFEARHFRLQRRWRELLRAVLLWLLDEPERQAVLAQWLPLEAWTWPRVWATPEQEVELLVRTRPGAMVGVGAWERGSVGEYGRGSVGAWERGSDQTTRADDEGRVRWSLGRLPVGRHRFRLRAAEGLAQAETEVEVEITPRRQRYREALDRVMRWFERSGVLPAADGSSGVWSQRCLAWLDGGPVDTLASPFRVDCNAMTAEAFYEYGLLTGDDRWCERAENVAATFLALQYLDRDRASYGGFPWLYEHNQTLYFWDDHNRVAQALLHLYVWTGREKYLEAALRTGELFRQIAREDGCVWRHAIGRDELDRLGRALYRSFSQGPGGASFDAMRWYTLAALTGDELYRQRLDGLVDVWTGRLSLLGAAYAARWRGDEATQSALAEAVRAHLNHPDVQRVGTLHTMGGAYTEAFQGDCGIGTFPEEPLTDQLYHTGWIMLYAWLAYQAGCPEAKELAERTGDYLVRIQFASSDPRLDGCWMRGFDFEHWEYYGAPYDPFYGPYSAYTGWMNAIIARALALYLRDADPFVPPAARPAAQALLARVRQENPPDYVGEENVARGATYTFSSPPSEAYGDGGLELTDGVVDGHWSDGRSVGWHLEEGETLELHLEVDLGQPISLGDVTQRYGALQGNYNPDRVAVAGRLDGQQWQPLGEARFGRGQPGYLYLRVQPPRTVRYLRFELTKTCRDAATDFLFVGETQAFGEGNCGEPRGTEGH